ncbi:26348_t:CDS:1, partial [Dentiscutata erythropus]
YANLYMKCWDSEPEKRPRLYEILTELEKLSKEIKILSVINIKHSV